MKVFPGSIAHFFAKQYRTNPQHDNEPYTNTPQGNMTFEISRNVGNKAIEQAFAIAKRDKKRVRCNKQHAILAEPAMNTCDGRNITKP